MSTTRPQRGFWSAYALGAATIVGAVLLWNTIGSPPPAYGQVPDAGAQRNAMVQELKTANKQLGEAVSLLKQIRDAQKGESKEQRGQAGPKRP